MMILTVTHIFLASVNLPQISSMRFLRKKELSRPTSLTRLKFNNVARKMWYQSSIVLISTAVQNRNID